MSDDPDLRSELERLAASVGDPPEHGLDRVAARRHRRLRRRRGAVATAAVLAVLTVGAVVFAERADHRETVTASGRAQPEGVRPELPRALEVVCDPTGITVPVASVRPQRDGLLLHVTNALDAPTNLQVRGSGWSSGDVEVAPGSSEVRLPVPPGKLTVGCEIAGEVHRRRADLVDVDGYYREPRLTCDDDDRVTTLRDLPVEPADAANLIAAARGALAPRLVGGTEGDGIGPLRGYQSQRLGDPTSDPVVQVTREGDVVAFAHVRGEGGAPSPPWTTVSEVEVCASAVAAPEQATTTEPTEPEGTPPPP